MIIDDLLKEIKNKELLQQLQSICNKMKSENNYKFEPLEITEILYYHKYSENDYYEKVLSLSFDMLEDNIFYIETWEINKNKIINENKKEIQQYKKLSSKKINSIHAKQVLINYATILKKAINEI